MKKPPPGRVAVFRVYLSPYATSKWIARSADASTVMNAFVPGLMTETSQKPAFFFQNRSLLDPFWARIERSIGTGGGSVSTSNHFMARSIGSIRNTTWPFLKSARCPSIPRPRWRCISPPWRWPPPPSAWNPTPWRGSSPRPARQYCGPPPHDAFGRYNKSPVELCNFLDTFADGRLRIIRSRWL